MKISNVRASVEKSEWFKVLQTSEQTQTALMTLAPGKASGPMGNEHPQSEQTLLVLEGELLAEIGDDKHLLRKGDMVIVPKKTKHRFVNHAGSPAVTFNVYCPPAY